MKVVIAPDSFKDALRAGEVAQRIADGLKAVMSEIEIDHCPVADGGEGFIDAIVSSHGNVQLREAETYDPLGGSITARWVMLDPDSDAIAVIELAAASGLELIKKHQRDPTKTSTAGTGWLIAQVLDAGAKQLLIGVGGSATNDGAIGIAQCLGIDFYDSEDHCYSTMGLCGNDLAHIARIKHSHFKPLASIKVRVACDVTNPLAGPNGAAYVYAPQKGATPEQVEELDSGLRHMAKLWRDQLGVDVEDLPGAGAAGGVGGGLVAMLGAELVPGAELVLDTIGFDERIKDADLVITGEGRLDSQSLNGKAAMAVAKRCQRAGVPCVALVSSVGEGAERSLEHGLSAYHVIGEGLPAEESIRRTGELLEAAAMKVAQERLLN